MVFAAIDWEWSQDGWLVGTAIMCAVAAALLGNFLVLRKMSMLGDAITHAVLPGLAAAFLITHSRSSFPMFLGAVIVGVLTAFFTEWIRRVGNVDEGASMGVVFTSLFALGLVMIVQAADKVHLDADCVLYGALETTPLDQMTVFGTKMPRAFVILTGVMIANLLFVTLLFKELKLSSFDPALATTTGFNASLVHYLLMIFVAVTAVASFESVGSVLVVAMFVVPPAAAYLLTDRLGVMIVLSVLIAIASAVSGHLGAMAVPQWFGYKSTTTSSMMSVAAGGFFAASLLFSPRHGIVIKFLRRLLLSWKILCDDIVALLYRFDESEGSSSMSAAKIQEILFCRPWTYGLAARWLGRRGDVVETDDQLSLTKQGRTRAQNLVRSHRLWEQYLQEHAGVEPGRVHPKAERLEHFTDAGMREKLDSQTQGQIDPHGQPIPREGHQSDP